MLPHQKLIYARARFIGVAAGGLQAASREQAESAGRAGADLAASESRAYGAATASCRRRIYAQTGITMLIEVKVRSSRSRVAEATLLNWHKQPGSIVNRDENLVDIETDKVVLETPAPDAACW
jgi:hypothetical protein